MHSWISRLASAGAALLLATSAWAELPHGSLQFITPNATVGAHEAIPIWVRLTLDADSPALSFSSYPLTGFLAADLPTEAVRYDPTTGLHTPTTFARIDGAMFSAVMYCAPSFNCSGGQSDNYGFEFGHGGLGLGTDGLVYRDNFNLAPGQSFDYLFGTFTPKAGGAAAGVYTLPRIDLTLSFQGVDADNNFVNSAANSLLASSCTGPNPTCTFTRTVVAVPEPASYALMAFGLLMVGFGARRKAGCRA